MPGSQESREGEKKPTIAEYFRDTVSRLLSEVESKGTIFERQLSGGRSLKYGQFLDKCSMLKIDYHYAFEIKNPDLSKLSGIYISQPKVLLREKPEDHVFPMTINYRMFYNLNPHPQQNFLFRQLAMHDYDGSIKHHLNFVEGYNITPVDGMAADEYEFLNSFHNDLLRLSMCSPNSPVINYFEPPDIMVS